MFHGIMSISVDLLDYLTNAHIGHIFDIADLSRVIRVRVMKWKVRHNHRERLRHMHVHPNNPIAVYPEFFTMDRKPYHFHSVHLKVVETSRYIFTC